MELSMPDRIREVWGPLVIGLTNDDKMEWAPISLQTGQTCQVNVVKNVKKGNKEEPVNTRRPKEE